MLRSLPTITVMLALALYPAQAHAASDKPAKATAASKAAADPHKPAKGHDAATTDDAKAAKGHDTKAAETKTPGKDAAPAKGHDVKTAAREPDAHVPAAASSGDAARTEGDLEALNDRIQRRLAEAVRARKPPAAAAASATSSRPRTSHMPVSPLAPRVQVIWRTEVAWPVELQDVPAPRVSVAWSDGAQDVGSAR